MLRERWAAPAASVLCYVAVTAFMGRHLLAHLSSAVANDAGDPLFTAGILHWNAHTLPLTEAWWQLPIFHPVRDALALSEHLLGLSVISTPINWLTDDPVVAYNLTTLLTFPLSAIAMYALVFRLTRSAAGAFLGGLAFGFAPYRIAQLSHIQVLAAFWAPLALLGLHAYVESGKRRWLALYGTTWMLQAAANLYCLVLLTSLVVLWVLWFVVARRQWRALAMIAIATVIASVPLAPILYKYAAVHAHFGFVRPLEEVHWFSADVTAVLCASSNLAFWGWVRVGCRPEGEIFPGIAVFLLFAAACCQLLGWVGGAAPPPLPRLLTVAKWLLGTVAIVYALILASVVVWGPWQIEALGLSTSSIRKPLLILLAASLGAFVLSSGVLGAVRRSSTTGFYVVAAIVMWLFALGPTITLMGIRSGIDGPFRWLLNLPGTDGLRAPARFWLMTMLCLATTVGLVLADLLKGRRRWVEAVAVIVAGSALVADGWIDRIPLGSLPASAPDSRTLAGGLVLELPAAVDYHDIAAGWRAVTGGWRSVNGASGYSPSYYSAVAEAALAQDDGFFRVFQQTEDLHVVVRSEAPSLQALVARQPGAALIAAAPWATQYRLPHRPISDLDLGQRQPIASVRSLCDESNLGRVLDGDDRSRWVCPPEDRQEITVDLGAPATVGAIVQVMGMYYNNFPRNLTIDTSSDGEVWSEARTGSTFAEFISGAMRHPKSPRIEVSFASRTARYLRMRTVKATLHWSIAELEVWSGSQPRS